MRSLKLSQVDLNLLLALDALLRTRNVTLAGREIGLSQPAMSSALGRLRELFGDRLFERAGAEYKLTPVAEALAEPLKAALCAVQRTLDHNAKFDPTTSTRSFRLAVSDHLLTVFCPRLVQRLHQLAPAVRLHTRHVTPDVGMQLAARQLDLSIQPANLVNDCASQRLFEDRWVAAVWRGNRAIEDQITEQQLCTMPHASFRVNSSSLAEQVITPPLGQKPNVQVTTRSFACLPFLVLGTPLIALLQRSLGEWAAQHVDIRVLELPIPTPVLSFEMSWNPMYTPDPALAWLREVVAELAESMFGPPAPLPV